MQPFPKEAYDGLRLREKTEKWKVTIAEPVTS